MTPAHLIKERDGKEQHQQGHVYATFHLEDIPAAKSAVGSGQLTDRGAAGNDEGQAPVQKRSAQCDDKRIDTGKMDKRAIYKSHKNPRKQTDEDSQPNRDILLHTEGCKDSG